MTVPTLNNHSHSHSNGSSNSNGTDALMVLDPKYIITIYEIMNAMEGLYEFLFRYAEDWNRNIKDWLFKSLKQYMTLPIEQPDVLKVILYCITRENKLFAPETILVVQQVISESFEEPESNSHTGPNTDNTGPNAGSKSKPSSLAGVLKSVNRMVDTLNYVVGDLVPLLPPEFNVIRMFTERANIKIREDINTFYENNRNDIGNRDLLKLLSFADRQGHVLRKFGVDTSVVTQLSQDLLLQYRNTTQSLMKQWILRIAEADEKAQVFLINSNSSQDIYSNVVAKGQITHWPEDLMKCVSEQLLLIQKELEDETRDSVSLLILKLLVGKTNELVACVCVYVGVYIYIY